MKNTNKVSVVKYNKNIYINKEIVRLEKKLRDRFRS